MHDTHIVLTFTAAVYPATVAGENALTTDWTNNSPIGTKSCWSILGTAMCRIDLSCENEKSTLLPPDSASSLLTRAASFANSHTIAAIQAAPCAMNVAHASPFTPHSMRHCSTVKTRSSPTLMTEENNNRSSGVRLSPMALKAAVAALYSITNATPYVYICK